jgi:hypothetical protein
MTGAVIDIDDASAADKILSIKERVFAVNAKLPVRRQRLMYRPGPHGMAPLADDETLGGAGVEQDGSAELDVLFEPLTDEETKELGREVYTASSAAILVFFKNNVIIIAHIIPMRHFLESATRRMC